MSIARIAPFLVLFIILASSMAFVYEDGSSRSLHNTALSYIPENSTALAYLNENGTRLFLFSINNLSAAIFSEEGVSISTLVPPVFKPNTSLIVNKIGAFESMPLFSLKAEGANGSVITGPVDLMLRGMGIRANTIDFASPIPGVIIAGSLRSIMCSLNSSSQTGSSNLIGDLNFSATFSFVYDLNEGTVETISGNFSSNVFNAVLLVKSVKEAVYISIALQYLLGSGFVVLPSFYTILIIGSTKDPILFMQYDLIRMLFMSGGIIT
jgi:hypothetical protein